MPPKNKTFDQLQAVWDKKLKKSGFEDIETRDGNLKNWDSLAFRKPSSATNRAASTEATAEYYRLAEHFLHVHKFKNLTHKHIWELHVNGKSVKHFRSRGAHSTTTVYKILNDLIEEMMTQWKSQK